MHRNVDIRATAVGGVVLLVLALQGALLLSPSAASAAPQVELKPVCNQPPPRGDPTKRWWGFSYRLLGGPLSTWVAAREDITNSNSSASGSWTDANGDTGAGELIAPYPLGTVTITYWAEPPNGNLIQDPGEPTIASATLANVCQDQTPPQVVVTSPPEGAVYTPFELVPVHYGCGDEPGGSGLASCTGSVPDGGALDTTRLGAQTFVVTAVDNDGNTTVARVHYTVAAPTVALPTPPTTVLSASTPGPATPAPATSSPAPSGKPSVLRISPLWTVNYKLRDTTTRITALKLSGLPAHTRLQLDCQGGGCRTRRIVVRPGDSIDLAKLISQWWLQAGTTLEVRVTARAAIGFFMQLRMQANDRPKITSRCLTLRGGHPRRRCPAS